MTPEIDIKQDGRSFIGKYAGWILFSCFVVIYLATCAPALAPYRDAGEMVSVTATLGVAHPPGYPVYTVLGHLFSLIPIGSLPYRVTLLSVISSALSLFFLFRLLRVWTSVPAAAISTLCFGFSRSFWDLSTVPEMYTLGILLLIGMLNAVFVDRNPVLFSFMMGLSLGVRMDFLLLAPILSWVAAKKSPARVWGWMVVSFSLGATVFLYLPIRSHQDPWLDWGNPETLGTLFNSVSRKSYSGTLDLLSLSYAKGENFFSTLALYTNAAWGSFGLFLLCGVWGVRALFRGNRVLLGVLGGIFLLSGPVFFFLANMPPNPHAVAILDASYVVPDLMVAIFVGFGIADVLTPGVRRVRRFAFLGIMVIHVLFLGMNGFQKSNKRNNWALEDYVQNVLRSVPENAVLVMRKDVQLFSLWAEQLLNNRRRDISLISAGLSASPWYWDMKKRWPTAQSPEVPLKDLEGWEQLAHMMPNRFLVAGFETEVPVSSRYQVVPQGMVVRVDSRSSGLDVESVTTLKHLMLDRNGFRYGETPDFFTTDLIGDTARAFQFMGHHLMQQQKFDDAYWFFKRSQRLDPSAPQSASDEAYMWFIQNKFDQALSASLKAVTQYRQSLMLAQQYKSLPSVVRGLKTEYGNVLVIAGASMEKTRGKDQARIYYQEAMQLGGNAQAFYNMAVTYWNEDWDLVVNYMKQAAQINPSMPGVQNYLAVAEQRRLERVSGGRP